MMSGPEDEKVYPTDRQVVDVMDAAAGQTEDEVVACLHYLQNERKLCAGKRNGPRSFSWFRTVVGDYFQQKRARQEVANPSLPDEATRARTALSDLEFNRLMDTF